MLDAAGTFECGKSLLGGNIAQRRFDRFGPCLSGFRRGHRNSSWKAYSSSAQRQDLYTAPNTTETRQRLFGNIAPVYDELNDRLSFGQHKVWKQMAVNWACVSKGANCLDLCCGSGDLSFLLAKAAGPTGKVVGLDFAAQMLQYARQQELERRTSSTQQLAEIEWKEADATQLPFQDNSFDAATMGYGLRNVASISSALRELHRVLKPKSKAAILDFNNASKTSPLADFIQGWALKNVVVPAASSYGLEEEYRYLRPSIQAFPSGREQEQMARQAGFSKAIHHEISFGLMGVLVLQK